VAPGDSIRPTRPRRPLRRPPAPNREALLVAARDLFAAEGPAHVSIRKVAETAGCSHTLVGRHFTSKAGLEAAVIERVADELGTLTAAQCASEEWAMGALVDAMRRQPSHRKLLVRCALGEFDDAPLHRGHTLPACLAGRIEVRRGGVAEQPGPQAASASFAALSTVLGLLSYEGLLVAGSRVSRVSQSVRDAALCEAAELIVGLGVSGEIDLSLGTSVIEPTPAVIDLSMIDAPSALLEATIDLYAAPGPAALTTREIAERAGVNQGLIYHYFTSRGELLRQAIELANSPLQSLAAPDLPVDLHEGVRRQHQTRSLRILARLEASGVAVTEVRSDFVVFDRLLSLYPRLPTNARPAGLTDPRLAVFAAAATALGSNLWGGTLRRMLGIADNADTDSLIAEVVGYLLNQAQ
jgi:TetR/AcrR family transcriptional regulator, repressor for neighboring sulfatase